jgi:hypothetical protein
MKAIETKYKGIMFRSRLEARWAIFMDTMGVKYDYEPEAFDLGDGIFYTPDFWLPEVKAYLEIKPEYPSSEETEKAHRLATHTNKNVFIQYDSPRLPDHGQCDSMICVFPGYGEDFPFWWCECRNCHRVDIQWSGMADRIKCRCPGQNTERYGNHDSPRLIAAYGYARGYRFWNPKIRVTT